MYTECSRRGSTGPDIPSRGGEIRPVFTLLNLRFSRYQGEPKVPPGNPLRSRVGSRRPQPGSTLRVPAFKLGL